jgi:predicted nucleic acid-binding protein
MRAAGARASRMSATDFFDSNVLLYLLSADTAKANRTEEVLFDGGTISVQVLDEFAAVASRKFRMPLPDIRNVLAKVRDACTVVVADVTTHELGLNIAERYKFSVYDSMLLAAAVQAGCETFHSEDMHHGQRLMGLTVRNPFRD